MIPTSTRIVLPLIGFALLSGGCTQDDDPPAGDDDTTAQEPEDECADVLEFDLPPSTSHKPAYSGEIDLETSNITGSCTASVPLDPQDPEVVGEGAFHFDAEFLGWAMDCFVNLHDRTSTYCEAWDPDTGNPCTHEGHDRHGWQMVNDAYGWEPPHCWWDYWSLDLDYVGDLDRAIDEEKTLFVCEDAGSSLLAELCCQDDYTEITYCVEVVDW